MKSRLCGIVLGTLVLNCLLGLSPAAGVAQEMKYPVSAVVAEDGTIYVADLNTPAIWKIVDGKIEKYFDASKKFRTPLNRPRCLAVDGDGRLLAGDSATREVYRFDESAKPVPLTKGGIGIPRAIVVLPSGDLMVTDQELQCIWKVPAAGGAPEKFADVPGVIAMCVDKQGNFWVTSGPKVELRKITPDGKVENVIEQGPFENPQEIAVDDSNTLYIADNYAATIWKVAPGAEPAKLAEGDPLVRPTGVTCAGDKLIVTDPHAKSVFEIDASGMVTPVAGSS